MNDTLEEIRRIQVFGQFLTETKELYTRAQVNQALAYSESEWDAFCYGWNAARQFFESKK